MNNSQSNMHTLQMGEIIGERYRIVGTIGRGGMGVVYAVEDMKLEGTLRALKVTISNRSGSSRYSDEAYTLMQLQHPHLPLILDYFTGFEEGCEVLVMDYIDGQTITAAIGTLTSFTFNQMINIAIQLCSALCYLHSQSPSIIHRDLKPSNVMIDNNGHIKLIDFGISRRYKDDKDQDTTQLGTVGYAAPEQAGTAQSDARTDVYGFGALLYYMVSGGRSYSSDRSTEWNQNLFDHLQSELPAAFKTVLQRMLQRDPQFRFQTMDEVERALRTFEQRLPRYDNLSHSQAESRNIPPAKRVQACVLSLSSGAGATFITVTLAALLEKLEVATIAAEYCGLCPEWHGMLPKKVRPIASEQEGQPAFDQRYINYKQQESKVSWLTLLPEQPLQMISDDQRFEQMLRQLKSEVTLIDLSDKWNEPRALQLLKESRLIFIVADPCVAKWQLIALHRLTNLAEELKDMGCRFIWIANKDMRFRERSEWLALFPVKPAAAIPLLPTEAVVSAQWNGQWITDETRHAKRLNRAFQPIFALLYNEFNTK